MALKPREHILVDGPPLLGDDRVDSKARDLSPKVVKDILILSYSMR